MTCPSCGDCAAYFARLVRVWYTEERTPRRTHEEVVQERRKVAEARANRREFHARRRAEKEAKRALLQDVGE